MASWKEEEKTIVKAAAIELLTKNAKADAIVISNADPRRRTSLERMNDGSTRKGKGWDWEARCDIGVCDCFNIIPTERVIANC